MARAARGECRARLTALARLSVAGCAHCRGELAPAVWLAAQLLLWGGLVAVYVALRHVVVEAAMRALLETLLASSLWWRCMVQRAARTHADRG